MSTCAFRAGRERQGPVGWHVGDCPAAGGGTWPCFPTVAPPMSSGHGGGRQAVDGSQMGYQVCPQSTLRLLWSRQLLSSDSAAQPKPTVECQCHSTRSATSLPCTPLHQRPCISSLSLSPVFPPLPPEAERLRAGNLDETELPPLSQNYFSPGRSSYIRFCIQTLDIGEQDAYMGTLGLGGRQVNSRT